MDQANITLVSFGYFENNLPEKLAEAVRAEFSIQVVTRDAHIDFGEFYDPGRRQYNGNKLLKVVDSLQYPNAIKVLGLFSVDLYIPILTYIFGQAALGGRSGIASLYRLKNESYGMPEDKEILLERFKKEVIHELGHTFGLIHCHVPSCVMRSSTYVEDIDLKKAHFCPNCRASL